MGHMRMQYTSVHVRSASVPAMEQSSTRRSLPHGIITAVRGSQETHQTSPYGNISCSFRFVTVLCCVRFISVCSMYLNITMCVYDYACVLLF